MGVHKHFILPAIISILLIVSLILFMISGDDAEYSTGIETSLTLEETVQYRALSMAHCSGCHVFPEPDLLPKKIWMEQTLPHMGPKMGINSYEGITYPKDTREHVPAGHYPDIPQLSEEDWGKILAYYAHQAPEQLPRAERIPSIQADPLFFRAHAPEYSTDYAPTATFVKFDPGNRKIYTSDIDGTNLLIFNERLELENTLFLSSPVSDLFIPGDLWQPGTRELYITYLGSMLPSDAPEGFIIKTEYNPGQAGSSGGEIQTLLENLVRPVQTLSADLTRDGYRDLLVHEFGHRAGSLFWLRGTAAGYHPQKNILIDTPGCIQSYTLDFTGNGLSDIVSLCTQKDQAIYLFENKGDGDFERSTLLRFPITAGSSSFELADMNGNGHPDIVYTSGDNADFSITFKPYHGVFIFENDGNNAFSEVWFYPVNGAYQAKARDFSGDGKPDIAVISFFGDYANVPEENFLLFLNDGNEENSYSFTPYHHPEATNGRWIRMDVADWTGNGRDDILLANYSLGPDITEEQAAEQHRFTEGPLFLLLENTGGDEHQ